MRLRPDPMLAVAIVAGLAARVVFWAMTDRRIDDSLITVKHAANAVGQKPRPSSRAILCA